MNASSSCADLHVYSRHSDRAADWVLRRLDFPASASEPRLLYQQLRTAGMEFVTLTDHHSIEGCLEIADLPGVFISEEVTTYFPDDGCKIYILVYGITEAQHRAIHAIRENIHDLRAYLDSEGIAHAVAHPLVSINDKLEIHHVQRLALLFRHFEAINGLRHRIYSQTIAHVLGSLTPERIDEYANATGLTPTHPEPWRKVFVGGSDDHGGLFPGRAYTETPKAGRRRNMSITYGGGTAPRAARAGRPFPLRIRFTAWPSMWRGIGWRAEAEGRPISWNAASRVSWRDGIRLSSLLARKWDF